MKTIVEPKEHIDKLWGKQRIHEDAVYRQMRYVLRVDHDGKVLLHNVVTGQLVVLSEDEAATLEKLPAKYSLTMEQLVTEHYLVPEDYDEYQQVGNLRLVLQRLYLNHQSKNIISYTILPTTACNARCYYCFEQGCKTETMTQQTAHSLVEFIVRNCGGNRLVSLMWFGGEPTIATDRIDQICQELKDARIQYVSRMSTNGYLFDEDLVAKAIKLWHLQEVQICVDGTEISYNKTKAFVGITDNPYRRVMRNIGSLIRSEVHVRLRMNFDLANYQEFSDLVEEVSQLFGQSNYLHVMAHPVVGEYEDHDGHILHGSDAWFARERLILNRVAREKGLQRNYQILPNLAYSGCEACDDRCVVITPSGRIVNCPEQFDEDQVIGDVWLGITDFRKNSSWKETADYQICKDCQLYPNCFRVAKCGNKGYCHKYLDYAMQYQRLMKETFDISRVSIKERMAE